ncbi:hypothetical protein GE115_03655 [Agromyces sp. CFH 90414]|uniref:Uncharacterized protein n=1 Tax=Agromyces agglutinans TaxID=2662258 RepID=A0A6I2F9D1_9MICO|nr:DUF6176 family protein [Agromyces agglutinans]MRG58966.1 hypothetical protein [Agromyces agglutinans]
MIHLVARRIRSDQRDRVVGWLREIDGPRRPEALESLAAEGVDHEAAMIIDTSDGPVIVYAMQTDDLAGSRDVADAPPWIVDAEHRAVMLAVGDGPAPAEVVLDLRADGAQGG